MLSRATTFAKSDIEVETLPERREVEIFELQHRPISRSPSSSGLAMSSKENFAYFHHNIQPHSHSDMHASASAASISTSLPPPTIPAGEWLPVLWSPQPYTPSSPVRVAGQRPNGAKHFEDVRPPKGWRWTGKKWSLDLLAQEWVQERCLVGVEVEVEGGRWVVDVQPTEDGSETGQNRDKWRYGEWRRRRWVRVVERVAVVRKDD
jgi:hypothetical protein